MGPTSLVGALLSALEPPGSLPCLLHLGLVHWTLYSATRSSAVVKSRLQEVLSRRSSQLTSLQLDLCGDEDSDAVLAALGGMSALTSLDLVVRHADTDALGRALSNLTNLERLGLHRLAPWPAGQNRVTLGLGGFFEKHVQAVGAALAKLPRLRSLRTDMALSAPEARQIGVVSYEGLRMKQHDDALRTLAASAPALQELSVTMCPATGRVHLPMASCEFLGAAHLARLTRLSLRGCSLLHIVVVADSLLTALAGLRDLRVLELFYLLLVCDPYRFSKKFLFDTNLETLGEELSAVPGELEGCWNDLRRRVEVSATNVIFLDRLPQGE